MISLAHGDVEAGLARAPLLLRPLAHSDLPQRAVVGVQHPAPGDGGRVDIQAHEAADLFRRQVVGIGLVDAQFLEAQQHGAGEVALAAFGRAEALEEGGIVHVRLVEHARVDGCSQQVVGRSDGVQVAGEVQVELLHRDHLTVTAAGRAALDAEGGSLAGLADAGEDLLAQVRAQGLAQADGGGRLAFAQRRRRNRRHHDVVAGRCILEPLAHIE